jgi:AraC family transcriptional regulator of adaptative response/methylated-DNA-[protein]-cysteine methyltransferase
MTPATYRRGGAGAEVGFVTIRCALGWLLVAATPSGLCAVKLGDSSRMLQTELRRELPHAVIRANRGVLPEWIRAIVASFSGSTDALSLPLDVRATAFQWRVWRALQAIAPGDTRSYSDIATQIGQPSAVRAVARACATNPVCLVVPCHRVIAKDGGLGGYRWGLSRKERLLQGEKTASRDGRAGRQRQAK